ncbi:MAG: tRNA(adenine34) deaminase [Candidatus Azotimanducaceae bacterium]|jgi:tRNA(adenine34) deaminase
MDLALAQAGQAASQNEVPIGAVIVLNGVVIGAGFNQTISQCDPTAHAEIVAIRAAATLLENYRLVGAELFVTIEPCTMCAGALVQSRIKRVIFGAAEPRAGALCSSARVLENPGLNHRVDVVSGIRAAQAARLMSDFFKDRR